MAFWMVGWGDFWDGTKRILDDFGRFCMGFFGGGQKMDGVEATLKMHLFQKRPLFEKRVLK